MFVEDEWEALECLTRLLEHAAHTLTKLLVDFKAPIPCMLFYINLSVRMTLSPQQRLVYQGFFAVRAPEPSSLMLFALITFRNTHPEPALSVV